MKSFSVLTSLLVLILFLSQTVMCNLQAVSGPGEEDVDCLSLELSSFERGHKVYDFVNQTSVADVIDQKSTKRGSTLDCYEELPAKIELRFSGGSGLNTIVHVAVFIDPEEDVRDTEVRIFLPEGFSLFDGSLQWNGDLTKNARVKIEVSVVVKMTGLWRIAAVAISKSLSGYNKICSSCCYIQATEKETLAFDEAPECSAKTDSLKLGFGSDQVCLDEHASGGFTVCGYWYYQNSQGTLKPARYSRVELWKTGASGDALLSTTSVRSDGYYEFSSVDDAGSFDVYVKMFCQAWEYAIVRVVDSNDVIYWSQTDVRYNVTEGIVDMGSWVAEGVQARGWTVYDNIVDGYFWLLDQTGWRKRFEVYARVTYDPMGSYSTGDGMVIYPLDAYSRDTTLHEYGHCINYEARGGSFPPSAREDPVHYPDTESDLGWAFREGWAEFFECAVDNDPWITYNIPYGSVETTVYADGPFGHGDSGDWDGDVVEGAVAQVIWDIFDGVNPNDYLRGDIVTYGDYISHRLDKFWDIFLNDDPDGINDVWAQWNPKDVGIWAIFRNARISIPRNVAVTAVNPVQGYTTIGEVAYVNVTLANSGNTVESVDLTVFANDTQVASLENVTLESSSSLTLSLSWNTSGFLKGDYAVSARAAIAPRDLDATDDLLEGGVITILSAEHDVGVISVVPSITFDELEGNRSIRIRVRNWGSYQETFNVTISTNASFIGLQTITLERGNYGVLAFPWNTSGLERGNYTINAYADLAVGEIDPSDNLKSGRIFVTIPGDVNGDRDVDIFDIVQMAGGYGAGPPNPKYDPNCDIDGDDDIDIFDIVVAAGNYGKNW